MPQEIIDLAGLRSSSRKSAALMLFSGCVVLASLIYSAAQIRYLDRQVVARRETIKSLDIEISQLRVTKASLEKQNQQLNTTIALVPGEQVRAALEASPLQVSSKLPPRVYVQIPGEGQRTIAQMASSKLRSAGYIVPGIEDVGKKAKSPKLTEVRYFHHGDESGSDLKGIEQALRKGGICVTAKYVELPSSAKIRARHFELWFGTSPAQPPCDQG